MDLFRMIFCVFFKDFQREILFRAIFFYTLSLLSSELSSGLLSLLRSFLGSFISSVPYFLQPLSPVLSSPVFPDSLHLPPFTRLISPPFLPLSSGSSLYPASPVFSSLLPSTSSPGFLDPSLFPAPSSTSSTGPPPPRFLSSPGALTPFELSPLRLSPFWLTPLRLSLPPPGRILYFFAPPASDPVSAFCPALSSGAALGSFCRPGSIFTRCGFQM